ncbi:fatty acid desaturase family protein [Frondihabitans cladoniiphilus]|uniref:Acyl-CoA desaturase n=1 Tax=Frondihabitans cladoniiphilus TaxID=715785 RepID=A0ABP8VPP3_9MICO
MTSLAARPATTAPAPSASSLPPVRNHKELPAGFRGTTSGETSKPISTYTALLAKVREAGLLKRRTGFYITVFVVITTLLGMAVTGSFLLGHSWFQLLIAAGIGLLFTQYAFLAHETAHRQVFESGKTSDRVGRILAAGVVGMSYDWWMSKHTRHHGNPNTIGKDGDIAYDTVSFLEQDAVKQRGLSRLFTQRQGYAFFPILLFEGINLHVLSYKTLFGRKKVNKRSHEIAMVTLRFAVYLGIVFWFLPVGMAFAFLGVQLAVFGLYMGAAFAPNHVGMPIIPETSRVDFLSKQVLTSRNIRGRGMTLGMGGLNYQVEHHLFPSMARPHLRAASKLVQEHCLEHRVEYTETTLPAAFGIVVRYLNKVGLAARRPFDCPMAAEYRPR